MPLYRFALSLSREPCDAADLTQQTFLLWASKGHQLREQSKVKTWLFTTLYREFLRGERKRGRECRSEEQVPDLQCLPVAASNLDGDVVVRALLDLEEIYRAPLSLFYLQEHSYNEIAEILQIPPGTVMSRISRGKAQLRKQLVYVVNQLGVPNINGYTVSDAGQLLEIASSTRDLAGGPLALPAEVSFTPDGTQLIAPNFIMQKTRSGRRTTGRSSPRHRATNRSARPTKSPSHPPAKLSRLRTAQFIAIPTAAAARSRLVWRITRSRS